MNAVRIKTVYEATGTVSDVTYSNIEFSGITEYGIVIEQVSLRTPVFMIRIVDANLKS